MKLKKCNYLFIISIFILSNCQWIGQDKKEETEKGKAVASVAEEILYEKDLEGLLIGDTSDKDSISIVGSYINNWVRKQLLINKAQEAIDFDEIELERKVLDYRYALMVHEYEKLKVNESLSFEVPEEEIQQY